VALSVANQAIFNLTRGQFLDIAHEKAEDVNLNDYWRMVEGKTGALFSASFAIGALLAGKSDELIIRFIELGQKIGMAFQVQDDYLGIWGKDDETGKSVESDLYSRKKTYPVQFALENLADVRDYWIRHDRFDEKDVTWIREKLQEHGVNDATLTVARMFYEDCLTDLSVLINNDEDAAELRNIIISLFTRMK
jgi:geranylgeranyl diphosphate synthase type I